MNPDSPFGLDSLKTVTKIEAQKKRAERLNIYLNQEFAFGICLNTFSHFQINLGQKLTEKQIQMILQHEQFEQAKEAAVKYLAIRMRSQKEIEQYLVRQRKYPPIICSRVIQYCLERNYLDDRLFCETYIRDQLNLNSNGLQKIRRALLMKGVNLELIEEAVRRLVRDDDQYKIALTLAKKKAATIKDDPKKRDKLYRFLLQRGFQPGVIIKVLQKNV